MIGKVGSNVKLSNNRIVHMPIVKYLISQICDLQVAKTEQKILSLRIPSEIRNTDKYQISKVPHRCLMDENSFKPAVRYRESSNPCGRIAVQLALLKENIYWVVKGEDILGGARCSARLATHFPTGRTTVIRGTALLYSQLC